MMVRHRLSPRWHLERSEGRCGHRAGHRECTEVFTEGQRGAKGRRKDGVEGPSIVASLFLCWLLVTTPQPSLPPAPTATRMLLAGVQSPERLCLVPGFVFFFWPYHTACEILTTGGGCCSIVQTLCNPMVCSTPGFPVLHHLPEFAQKLMSIESVMPSNHLILCCPLLLPPSIFSSIRVFSNESVLHIRWPKYWNFSFSSSSSSEYSG